MKIRDFIFTIIVGFVIVIALMNKSIHSYIEQKYHISLFDVDNEILIAIRMPSLWLDSMREKIFSNQEDLTAPNQEDQENLEPKEEITEPEIHYPLITQEGKIILKPNSTFLLIGDSMMQGVGLTLARELQKLKINVINLSKQSTGLTYASFFDWNQTLKDTFNKNPNIDVVVMMVGANDPYNMPKIKFKSEKWLEIYNDRIADIIDTTLQNEAVIAWYEAPIVHKEPLNGNLQFLNELYKTHIQEKDQVFLESNLVLCPDGIYTSYLKDSQGKSLRVRGSDGIHFSTYGSKLLSRLLLERLEILPDEDLDENLAENLESSTDSNQITQKSIEPAKSAIQTPFIQTPLDIDSSDSKPPLPPSQAPSLQQQMSDNNTPLLEQGQPTDSDLLDL